jgi:hypothetical protein
MRGTIVATVVSLLLSTPATAEKLTAFIDMCKTEVKGDVKDKLGLRLSNIDHTGFCVCVGLSLDRMVSDKEIVALAGKPLSEDFVDKLEAAEGLCRVLMTD